MAAVQSKRIFEGVEPLTRGFVSAVDQPAIGLEKHGRPQESIAVPPMARASGRAAKAENALIITVEFAAILMRLKPLLFGLRRRGLEPGLDQTILRIEMREIGYQILDDAQMVEWIDRHGILSVRYESRAGQPIRAVDVHCAGAADALSAGAAKGQRRVDFVLDLD